MGWGSILGPALISPQINTFSRFFLPSQGFFFHFRVNIIFCPKVLRKGNLEEKMLLKSGGRIGVLGGREIIGCTKKMDMGKCKYGLVNYVEWVSGGVVG